MYIGQSTLFPLGNDGLIGDSNTNRYASLTIARDIRFEEQKIIRDDGLIDIERFRDLNSIGPIKGIGQTRVFGDDGLVICKGSSVHGPWGSFPIQMFLSDSSTMTFIEAGKEDQSQPFKLFCFTDSIQPILVKDSTPRYMDKIPPEWTSYSSPSTGFTHKNRMFFIAGHNVYFSDPSSHEIIFENDSFNGTGGVVTVYPGEGDRIIAGISFRGLAILWKYPRGIYALNTDAIETSNWFTIRLSEKLG